MLIYVVLFFINLIMYYFMYFVPNFKIFLVNFANINKFNIFIYI